MPRTTSPRPARRRFAARGNLLTGLVLVLPLLIFYEIGVLFSDVMNGADFVTQTLLKLLGVRGFVILQVVLVVLVVGLALYLRKQQQLDAKIILPVLLESGVYALTMGTLIIFVMVDILHINPRLAAGAAKAGFFDRLVLSVGAGVHEELVFRLLLLGGIALAGERLLKLRRPVAVLIAFAVSSVLFSAAHHVGPLGEPFGIGVFTYRLIAGVFFGALYQFRGFAIAVYTHALYDIYVLVLR